MSLENGEMMVKNGMSEKRTIRIIGFVEIIWTLLIILASLSKFVFDNENHKEKDLQFWLFQNGVSLYFVISLLNHILGIYLIKRLNALSHVRMRRFFRLSIFLILLSSLVLAIHGVLLITEVFPVGHLGYADHVILSLFIGFNFYKISVMFLLKRISKKISNLGEREIESQEKLRNQNSEEEDFVEYFFKGTKENLIIEGRGFRLDHLRKPYNIANFEISLKNLQIDTEECLGVSDNGKFLFWKGKILNVAEKPKNIVVKSTRGKLNLSDLKVLINEIKLASYLTSHENLVKFLGASTTQINKSQIMLFTEFYENGNLSEHLRKNRNSFINCIDQDKISKFPITRNYENFILENTQNRISTFELLKWTNEILEGISYLHKLKIIHGSMRLSNVLLSSENTAKIANFNLTNEKLHIENLEGEKSWLWLPIESLAEGNLSVESDIYSLGLTFWEIFTLGDFPFSSRSFNNITSRLDLIAILDSGFLLPQPQYSTQYIYKIFLECWKIRPSQRISIQELKTVFGFVIKTG